MNALNDLPALESAVRRAVAEATVTDIHTHLFPPAHGNLLLWGVDELLTYHYLVAELFTVAPASLQPAEFWRLTKRQQADLVWEHVFLRHGGLSEAARGVMTCLNRLGLDVAGRDLRQARLWFDEQHVEKYLPRVLELSGVDYAVMTNNPFHPAEVPHWLGRDSAAAPAHRGPRGAVRAEAPVPGILKTALRIDSLIMDWPTAAAAMRKQGYRTPASPTAAGFTQARKFLADWAKRIRPLYLAASLPFDFVYPSASGESRIAGVSPAVHRQRATILDKVVLPAAKELHLPLALMIGVRRQVNPALADGGDAVGVADVSAVLHLCQRHADAKFLVTILSRVNQHELAVLGRKFRNLHLFGCWWFCNNPSIIEELTRLRVELLGTAFTCQHSDARVLDQLLYKWPHTRAVLADVLADKYRLQFAAGWRPTESEIRRDARALLGGAFEEFLKR